MKKEYQQIDSERKIRKGLKANWRTPSVALGIWALVVIEGGRTVVDHFELIKTFIEGLL